MTLSGIRTGLETRLLTISGLRVYKLWPGKLNLPAAICKLVAGEPYTTFSGNGMHRFEITVAVGLIDEDRAQTALDAYMDLSGASSIIAAIRADETLAGNAAYLLVGDWGEQQSGTYNDVDILFATLPVDVHITY